MRNEPVVTHAIALLQRRTRSGNRRRHRRRASSSRVGPRHLRSVLAGSPDRRPFASPCRSRRLQARRSILPLLSCSFVPAGVWRQQLWTQIERCGRTHSRPQFMIGIGQLEPHGQRPRLGIDVRKEERQRAIEHLAGKGPRRRYDGKCEDQACPYWVVPAGRKKCQVVLVELVPESKPSCRSATSNSGPPSSTYCPSRTAFLQDMSRDRRANRQMS